MKQLLWLSLIFNPIQVIYQKVAARLWECRESKRAGAFCPWQVVKAESGSGQQLNTAAIWS
jgi:hypothetical protein